jgi:PEP-CTERM motif-containing protein
MVRTQGWAELEVDWLLGMKSVRLSVTRDIGDHSTGFVFDDLSVDFIPEPSTISFLVCAGAAGVGWRMRRKQKSFLAHVGWLCRILER